jgi:hypothetical protein
MVKQGGGKRCRGGRPRPDGNEGGAGPSVPAGALQDENGEYILDENNEYIQAE